MVEQTPLDVIVVRAGPQTTVQDLGRPGHAALGVPRSGALDQPSLRLANRLVGNPESHAGLECLIGGLSLRFASSTVVAVTGASVPVAVDGRAVDWGAAVPVRAGARLALGAATSGLRAYVAVGGGIDTPLVLGSRSTDLLSGLGPPALVDGDRLPVGVRVGAAGVGQAAPRPPGSTLRVLLGPRDDAFAPESLAALDGATYVVGEASNRIGLRLAGPALRRASSGDARTQADTELASEGMVLGAVQVPPDGQPVVFLADHPTTGGYPVVGVVLPDDLPTCAQVRPGERITIRLV